MNSYIIFSFIGFLVLYNVFRITRNKKIKNWAQENGWKFSLDVDPDMDINHDPEIEKKVKRARWVLTGLHEGDPFVILNALKAYSNGGIVRKICHFNFNHPLPIKLIFIAKTAKQSSSLAKSCDYHLIENPTKNLKFNEEVSCLSSSESSEEIRGLLSQYDFSALAWDHRYFLTFHDCSFRINELKRNPSFISKDTIESIISFATQIKTVFRA